MKSFCGYFNAGSCRSCPHIETDYVKQLQRKEERLKKAFHSFHNLKFLRSVPSKPEGFRNKAKMTVTGTLERPVIGLSGKENLDQGRETLSCPIHHPVINDILAAMPEFIRQSRLVPYRMTEKRGELKGIIVFHSSVSGESYLRFILRSKESLDRIKKNLAGLQGRFPSLTCVSANLQPIPHAILEGEEEVILSEQDHILHRTAGMELQLGPKGFVQTNQDVAERLYLTAADWVEELQVRKFAELFCGQGAFSFAAAKKVEKAVGFEINGDAVEKANKSAARLNLSHLFFKQADAAEVEKELRDFGPDMVLVNPPRRGLAEALKIFKTMEVPHLIYSSCSLESLIRDVEALAPRYTPVKAMVFDMFPHTDHFETLVLLTKAS